MNKKIAGGVAAAVALTGIAVNLAFEPAELLRDRAYFENHTRYIQTDDGEEVAVEYTEPEELGKKDRLRQWILKLPVPVKALFLLPLWAVGALPVALGEALLPGLSIILRPVLGLVFQAAILLGVFCAVYKLVFPNRKVRELFKKKNRRWLLLGAAALTVTNVALSLAWPGWSVLRAVLMAAAAFGVLCLLWRKLCGRFKGPEPGIVRTKLRLEY